jgi:hypothetical protein
MLTPYIVATTIAGQAANALGKTLPQPLRTLDFLYGSGALARLPMVGALLNMAPSLGIDVGGLQLPEDTLKFTELFSKVLGQDFTIAMRGLGEMLRSLGPLEPRLRDIGGALVGLGGASIPNIGALLALSLGKPRRRYRDVGLGEFTGLDEEIQPLGEVIDEAAKSTTMDIRVLLRELAEEQAEREKDRIYEERQTHQGFFERYMAAQSEGLEWWKRFLESPADATRERVGSLSEAITEGLLPNAERVMQFLGPLLAAITELVTKSVVEVARVAHEPMSKGLTDSFADFLDTYRRGIGKNEEVKPDDVTPMAVSYMQDALRFGTTAHAFALLAEICLPLKELGIAQLAAALADAAAFAPIVSSTIGTRIRASLGRAAELDARRTFRTYWPGTRDVEAMWLEGRLTRDDYAERLRYEGWPERYIKAYLALGEEEEDAVPYKEPAARELAILYEDVDVTEAWILNMLRQSGYAPRDAEQLLTGVKLRAQKSIRQGLISELLSAYEDGLLYESDFRDRLAPLHLREESIRLLLGRANLGLAHKQAGRMATVHRTLVENDVVDLDQFRVSLRALGYIDSQVEIEASLVDAKRRGKLLKEEQRETEKQFRELQEVTVKLYEDCIRRGLATPDEYRERLLEIGFEPQLAAATAEVARVRQRPVLQLPTAETPEAIKQRVQELLHKEVLTRVTAKTIQPGLAALNLVALGMTDAEAEAQVRLAMARIPPEPAKEEKDEETPEQREARRIRTNEAITRYQAGELDEDALRRALGAAGVSDEVAAATVSRESTEKRLTAARKAAEATRSAATAAERAATAAQQAAERQRAAALAAAERAATAAQQAAERQRAAALAEIQRLQRDIILEAVTKGALSEQEAVIGLQEVGYDADTARLLVDREIVRHSKPAAP